MSSLALIWFGKYGVHNQESTYVNFCWVFATDFSEPLPYENPFCGNYWPRFSHFWANAIFTTQLCQFLFIHLLHKAFNLVHHEINWQICFTYCRMVSPFLPQISQFLNLYLPGFSYLKTVQPHSSNNIKTQPNHGQLSCKNATPFSDTSPYY